MVEGWQEDEYLILLNHEESRLASLQYQLEVMLPGFQVIGLRGWDDFIVRDPEGNTFTVPTVPCHAGKLVPLRGFDDAIELTADERYTGKIKWYVTPLVFGGDPKLGDNLIWISHDQHQQVVGWWNELYRRAEARDGG